mmetsp:Transcript_25557/g.47001  ORF Transcript_25557/g.47001 Transcript_25557/m.47001 type:complete len:87 (-) Transcript_25557:79-339(-)
MLHYGQNRRISSRTNYFHWNKMWLKDGKKRTLRNVHASQICRFHVMRLAVFLNRIEYSAYKQSNEAAKNGSNKYEQHGVTNLHRRR